jgi:hypothetical protein
LAELFLAAGVSGGLSDRLAGAIIKALLDQPDPQRAHETVVTAFMGTPELQERSDGSRISWYRRGHPLQRPQP